MLVTILLLISAVSWTLVYGLCIYKGFKEKTYCMPLWALGLNVCWEGLYAANGIPNPSMQAAANAVWFLFDCAIVVTWFKFGKGHLPEGARERFVPYSVATFATCLAFQLAFFLYCDDYVEAAQFSAFAQNLIMSVLFVVMLVQRGGAEGQSMVIAVAKCLGTLAPTIQQGIVQGPNAFILFTGIACFAWDVAYIAMLRKSLRAGSTAVAQSD